jgi:uncharacterized protein (TIGR03083 family)
MDAHRLFKDREGGIMNSWNAMTYDGKDTVLRVVRHEAANLFALAGRPETWSAATACSRWQVRDIVGHLVDTTESYFVAFDAARGHADLPAAYGLPGMAERAHDKAVDFRTSSQPEMLERLRADFDKMMEMFTALGPDEWTGLHVPHFYMGPLPTFFYPAFQLMDYAVHSWDIRQGTVHAHGLSGDTADLLVPFMYVLWQYTANVGATEPYTIGIRVTSGHNAGDTMATVSSDGLSFAPGAVDDLPATIEFDPGSFVLTTFGRANAGTIRGDAALAQHYLNLFFRI